MKIKLLFLTVCSFICSAMYSQWSTNPVINTPVCLDSNAQQNAYIVTDGKKGAIIVWEDYRVDTTNPDIYVQRLDAHGFPKWTANGVAICTDTSHQNVPTITATPDGGAIITWQDRRNGYANKDIYAQKVDSSGNVLWRTNGIPICAKPLNQRNPIVASDTKGGAIFVWEDSAATNGYDIYAQRVNGAGTLLWGDSIHPIAVCTQPLTQANPKIKPDGFGGAVICWQDRRFGLSYFIYAQRLDSIGDTDWTTDGVQVCSWAGGQTNPKIQPDGAGGAYIAWEDKRNGSYYSVYSQRLDGNGNLLWNLNAIQIAPWLGSQSAIDMTTDGTDGAILTWKDIRSGTYSIYTNNVTPAGNVTWSATGIEIATGIDPDIVGDGHGGAIIAWQDSVNAGGSWNVYSQRLDSTGAILWATGGAPVSIAAGGQNSVKEVACEDGGAIYSWQDKRNTINRNIFAQRLYADGTANSGAGIDELNSADANILCYPNPFNMQAILQIKTTAIINLWVLNVYDITGKLVHSETVNKSNKAIINKNNLNNGIYFYQAIENDKVLGSGKFVINE